MIEYIVGLQTWVSAVERGGGLDTWKGEFIITALDALGMAVSGAEAATFAPMVQRLGGLLLSDEFEAAYRYCVEITPALAGEAG